MALSFLRLQVPERRDVSAQTKTVPDLNLDSPSVGWTPADPGSYDSLDFGIFRNEVPR